MCKLRVKNIKVNKYLTIDQVNNIPNLVNEWLTTDDEYTLDMLITEQTIMFAKYLPECNGIPQVIKIETLEWVSNYQGRKNDYNSNITVWVTAIVDLGNNLIVRLAFDLFDSLIMSYESGCSGLIYKPY